MTSAEHRDRADQHRIGESPTRGAPVRDPPSAGGAPRGSSSRLEIEAGRLAAALLGPVSTPPAPRVPVARPTRAAARARNAPSPSPPLVGLGRRRRAPRRGRPGARAAARASPQACAVAGLRRPRGRPPRRRLEIAGPDEAVAGLQIALSHPVAGARQRDVVARLGVADRLGLQALEICCGVEPRAAAQELEQLLLAHHPAPARRRRSGRRCTARACRPGPARPAPARSSARRAIPTSGPPTAITSTSPSARSTSGGGCPPAASSSRHRARLPARSASSAAVRNRWARVALVAVDVAVQPARAPRRPAGRPAPGWCSGPAR